MLALAGSTSGVTPTDESLLRVALYAAGFLVGWWWPRRKARWRKLAGRVMRAG